MVLRRCPQCGSTSDNQYGFCIKCGYEFPEMNLDDKSCPLCGYSNPDEAEYCVKCGTPLILKNHVDESQTNLGPIVIKKEVIRDSQPQSQPRTSRLLIVLGYLFSILGGILGLIIAIYLSTRKDPVARKHGHIQLAIFVFYIALIAILYVTGNIPADIMTEYRQLLAGNFTML